MQIEKVKSLQYKYCMTIGKLHLDFYFRHRFEKRDAMYEFIWPANEWKITLIFKKQQSKLNNKIQTQHLIGFEFFIVKSWLKINL